MNKSLSIIKTAYKKEDGVTLLMAVLITSVLFLISIAVTTLVVQEIRSSRSSSLTEPAIIGAESAGEQGLYLYKKTNTIASVCGGNANTSQVTGSCSNDDVRISKTVSYQPAIITLQPNEVREIFLYDPVAPNSNLELIRNTADELYTTITFRHVTGTDDVDVNIATLDEVQVANGDINRGTSSTFNIASIPNSDDERLRILLTAGNSTVTLEISTTGYSCSTCVAPGIPDYPVVRAEACSAAINISSCTEAGTEVYRRRLDITVPR